MVRTKRPPFACCISRGTHSVNVFSVSKLGPVLCTIGDFTRFLPGYSWTLVPGETAYELWHIDTQRISLKHLHGGKRILIGGSVEDLRAGETIPYLAYSQIELQGQLQKEATLHAAALTRDGKGLLVMGKACSGKTTLALELCLHYGFKLIANDLLVIAMREGSLWLLAGTKHFFVRRQVIKFTHPQLLSFFGEEATGDAWKIRASIPPSEIGVLTEDEPVKLRYAVTIRLPADGGEVVRSAVNPRWARLYLYENLSRYIRRTCLPILAGCNDQYCLYPPSFDSPQLHRNRVKIMEHLIGTVGPFHLTGGFREVAEYIDELTQH